MKKIITVTTFLLLVCAASFEQQIQPQASNAELAKKLLAQSKSQRKTSNILLVSGGVILTTGVVIGVAGFSNSFNFGHPDKGSSAMDAGNALAISGVCVMAVGAPFAFMAKHSKKKAELLLQNNQALPNTSFINGRIYSLGIKLDL